MAINQIPLGTSIKEVRSIIPGDVELLDLQSAGIGVKGLRFAILDSLTVPKQPAGPSAASDTPSNDKAD